MEKGRITQVIGPVIDVEFTTGKLPMIRDALTVEVGKVFEQVLEDAGVFKRTEEGAAAFRRFVDTLR